MQVSSIQNQNINFKAAQLNILATGDNHGNVMSLPKLVATAEVNKRDIFLKADEKSTLNIFAIVGDFFINPSKKGFLTKPALSNGDIQGQFLEKTINNISESAGKNSNFDTVYTPGNHCLDGGDEFLFNTMKYMPAKTLVTNLNLDKSPLVRNLIKKHDNIMTSKIYTIDDDKNPKLKHRALFLGVTIPSMDFYNPGLLKGTEFYDNCSKKDSQLKEEDLQGTIHSVKKQVDEFKEKYPKGAVILLSHTGSTISKIIRDNVPEIDVILNGHDHKNLTSIKGKTSINSLGKDNEIIKSLNLRFNDKGNLDTTDMNTFFTDMTLEETYIDSAMQKYLNNNFYKDLLPLVKFEYKSDEVTELGYGNEVRYSNSYLANYLTSAVKRSVREVIFPDIEAIAIQSSIIRGDLKDRSNNMDLMKIFDGVSEDLSNVRVGAVTGKELVGLIVENALSNLKDPTRNTIIHWSDIQVNRTLIKEISEGRSNEDYSKAIKFRKTGTKVFIPMDLEKEYKILISDKYLVKDDIEYPRKIRDRFHSLHVTYDELLRTYLSKENFNVMITDKTKEKRIL